MLANNVERSTCEVSPVRIVSMSPVCRLLGTYRPHVGAIYGCPYVGAVDHTSLLQQRTHNRCTPPPDRDRLPAYRAGGRNRRGRQSAAPLFGDRSSTSDCIVIMKKPYKLAQ